MKWANRFILVTIKSIRQLKPKKQSFISQNRKENLKFWVIPLWILGQFFVTFVLNSDETRAKQGNLLRVLPAYRPEECDWAIRKFICLRCVKNGYQYAQNIYFTEEDRPIRIHGCYSETKGFFPIEEGRDHSTDFKE